MKKREIEQHPFEFMFRINGHPICQRFFNIYNFNPEVIDSLEMKELLDEITGMNNNGVWGSMGIIPKYLKEKSSEYLHHFHENPYLVEQGKDRDIQANNVWEKYDQYTFEILIDGEVVGSSEFSGNFFPPKVRYKVNLKNKTNVWGDKELDAKGKMIPMDTLSTIVKEIKKTFSQKSYTKEHMGYSLDYNTKLKQHYAEKYLTLEK